MKIAVAQNILRSALAVVRDVVPNSSDMPILSNVLIRTTADDRAELVATDLDVTISTGFTCQVSEPGETTVPAKFLASAVSAMTAGIIEFSTNDSPKASLVGGDVRYKMAVIGADQYPKAKPIAGQTYEIPQKSLREMLRQVSYAMLTNNSRRNINGVNLAFDGSVIRTQGTDGCRLSISSAEITGTGSFSVLIPDKSVRSLQRLLTSEDGTVKVTVDSDAIRFDAPCFVFQTRLVAEQFPDISAVIPKNSSADIPVDREQFLTTLRQASLSCSGDLLKLVLSVRSGEIVCSASEENTDARASFPVKYDGGEIKISINPNYIADILNALDDDVVTLGITDGRTPVVIRVGRFVGIVMPLRIN